MSKTNIPQIRFRTFNKKYQTEIAKDIFTAISDKNHADLPVLSASQSQGMIVRDDIGILMTYNRENVVSYKRVCPGQFVIHLRSFQGGLAHSSIEGITSPAYTILAFKNNQSQYDYYWKYIFSSDAFIKRLELVTYGIRDGRNISYEEFQKLSFIFPHPDEQVRVASLFQCLDDLIQSRQEAFAKLKVLKQSCLEKMFPREGAKVPEIRFKGFDGDWEETTLADRLEVSLEKNADNKYDKYDIFSVSGEYGVVNQIEFQGKSFAGASLLGYKTTSKGDIIYTKSPLKSQPYGIIKANKRCTGIVSTLYAVYKPDERTNADFIQRYFELDKRLNGYLRPLVNKGAKNTLLVSDEDAIKGVVYLPSLREQQAIADYFTSLDQLIAAREKELEKLRQIKKACLERMFVTD